MSFKAYLAAWNPGIPVTPGPGGVDEEQRYTPVSGVRHGTGPRTGALDQAAEVHQARNEITADIVLVVVRQRGRRRYLVPHDDVTEPRREALQLGNHGLAHVYGGTGGNVAVAPEDVPSRGRARGVEA
ncbi:hypothetical protein QFZ79_001199 [Arthrobacter sp. V4I6]|nr:hypothetical protein [Arthrobacter sp. V4I6]